MQSQGVPCAHKYTIYYLVSPLVSCSNRVEGSKSHKMSRGQEHSDGAKKLAAIMVTWKQPCCGCPGGSDEHVSLKK